jgi:UDP-glucuronate decarboxylase
MEEKMEIIVKEDVDKVLRELGDWKKEFKGRSCLVTGGAGFLGSYICDCLVKMNANVICLDNLSSGMLDFIEHLIDKPNFEYLEQDVSNEIKVDRKVDMIFHLASMATPTLYEEYGIEIIKANVFGTYNASELARRDNARFFFSSTSEVYGEPEPQSIPTPESYHGRVNCTTVRSVYDESKRCGESLCMAFRRKYGIDVRIARLFNVFGPRLRWDERYGRVIPKFLYQALIGKPLTVFGSGEQTRSYCYVSDAIEAILKMMALPNINGEIINIGNDERETSVNEIAEIVSSLFNGKIKIKYLPVVQEPSRRRPNISKARRLLKFKPKIKLEEGIRRNLIWLKHWIGKE